MKVPFFVGFLVMLALIGVNSIVTNRTIAQLEHDQQRIAKLRAVRFELETLLRAYVDAETGQRGFIITGDDQFLEPFKAARAKLSGATSQLKAMLGDDSSLTAPFDQLDEAGSQKLGELEATIVQRRAGEIEEVNARIRAGAGKVLMDQIRNAAAEISERNDTEVARVLHHAENAKTKAAVLSLVSAVVLGAGVIAVYFFSRMHLRERDAAKDALMKALASERSAHSEATHANNLKDEFLALVSHELRTPLNAMLGWIKFTPRNGHVTVALTRPDSIVALEVRDTGQGIAADFLPQIFDRFSQGDASTTRGHGGLGFARESDRKASINAGFTDHLTKPVDAGALLRKVGELIAQK